MDVRSSFSRRGFVGGVATALGYLTLRPPLELSARGLVMPTLAPWSGDPLAEYDAYAKLSFNENPYGPSASVMKAMTNAFKYGNRYNYPDGAIADELAKHHGVPRDNILLGAGSSEILDVVGRTFLEGDRKVIGVEPSFSAVYEHATGIKADVLRLPLLGDYRQDIAAMISAANRNHRDVGFVYVCNPNNPTGRIVTSAEIRQLLDGIPGDVPVLIDEAYHHFVDDPAYSTSVPYVLDGRPVIIARTFSKIAGLAGMRLGYAVGPRYLIERMRPHATGSINAIVKWGGVAALRDTASQAAVKTVTMELRARTVSELAGLGFSVIPSEANFFMVDIRRPVQPVIDEFKKKGVLVGRPFPPMNKHLRVSIGTPSEMARFSVAFREIFAIRG